MKIIISFILFFSINVFAEDDTKKVQTKAPYRVIGISCAKHEHCVKNPKSALLGGGYFYKKQCSV